MSVEAEPVRRGAGRFAAAKSFWRYTLRAVDYPESVAEWVDLLAHPLPIPGPFDWSLALGSHDQPSRPRRATTRLGALLDAWRGQGDHRAGETLARLLHRWVSHADVSGQFDLVTTRPPSLYSGPARDAASLLSWPGLAWPLAIDFDLWRRHAATSAGERGPRDRDVPLAEVFTVSSRVAGARLLLVEDIVRTAEITSQWTDLLRASGAVRVGVMAVCMEPSDV